MGSTTLEALLDRIVLQSDPKVVDLTSERKIATEVPGSACRPAVHLPGHMANMPCHSPHSSST